MKMLAKHMPDVEFVQLKDDVNWDTLCGFDLLFLQRPSNHAHKATAVLAKRLGIKLWLDYDDDLFNVPVSNPACLTYGDRAVQRDVMSLMAMADCITVSTANLQKKYTNFNKNTFVVPNAWNNRLMWYREADKVARAKVVLWRGTRTHAEDLDTFLPEIAVAAKEYPDWKFVFIGGAYWKTHKYIPEGQLSVIEPMEQSLFYETIYKLGAKIMIVPLVDNEFNRAKSNIAWQEGSFCGSAVLCPMWEEWKNPGAANYDGVEAFGALLRTMMMPNNCPLSEWADISWKHIQECLTLDEVNLQRMDIMKQLLGIS
jgi:hypothetical protein